MTGVSTADQRYYASTYGRFNTADPYQASANGANDPNTPLSWNKYSYVLGDPVNGFDPGGMFVVAPSDPGIGYGYGSCVFVPWACSPWGNGPILSNDGGDGNSGLGVSAKPFGLNAAAGDLNTPSCYQALGFNSAAAAQQAFSQLTFVQVNLGQLQIQSVPGGTSVVSGSPGPAQSIGNTVDLNSAFNFFDLSNVTATNTTTGTSASFNFLGAMNSFLGTNMSTGQLAQLIILHEFEHTPAGGNAPQEGPGQSSKNYNLNIYNNCISQ